MNKKQYKEYRRNQRIVYNCDGDPTWPNNGYFEKIPFSRPGRNWPSKHNLVHAWERAKREFEWRQRAGTIHSWQKEMIVVGNNNPDARAILKADMKQRMRYL